MSKPQPPAAPLRLFYSYSHRDEELRDELQKHLVMLKREGTIGEWHDRAIVAGQEWDREIDENLDAADIILLLVSPDFLYSEYCYDIEVKRAMERHDAGDARVIPVILRKCEWTRTPFAKLQAVPKNARPIKNFRDRDAAFNEVAQGIRRAAEQLLAQRPTRPAPAARSPQSPSTTNIPRPPAVGFVARRDEQGRDIVERLKEELAPGRGSLVALWGPGGSGKSTLAAEVARALRPAFNERLAWVSALGREDFSFSTLLDDIATQLGSPELRQLAPAAKAEQVRALLSASPALVVLDNFETIRPAEQTACAAFLAGCGECPALITTRGEVDGAHNVRLAAMAMDEAREFLRRLIEEAAKPSAFAGLDHDELIRGCEANPLVMQWVVRQIKLALRAQDALRYLGEGHGDAAGRVFDRSFNLPQLGDDGRDALLALSLFAPDASREALAATAGFGDNLPRLDQAVANLASLWLVETTQGNKRLLLRGLTRQLAQSRLSQDEWAADFRHRFVAYFLTYALAHERSTAEDLDAMEAEKDNLLSAQSLAFEGHEWQNVTLICFALNAFLNVRGYWGEAVSTGEQALKAARSSRDEPTIAGIAHNLAMIYQHRGELVDARRLYGESLEIDQRHGNQHGVAISLHQLGILAQEAGELEEARRLHTESLEIEKRLGDRRGIALTNWGLGNIALEEGDNDEAKRLFQVSLESLRELKDEVNTAGVLHQLGSLAQVQGEAGEARRLYAESLEIEKRLGNQHGIAISLETLGVMAEGEGDLVEAARLYRESLSIYERLGSPNAESVRGDLKRVTKESS